MKYIWINALIIIIPFLLSFEHRVSYYRSWPAVFLSVLVVGGTYGAWDVVATARGDWGFNRKYLLGPKIRGLPLEEVLFFATAPFSCIFILECMIYLLPEFTFRVPFYLFLLSAFIFGLLAYRYRDLDYTRTVFNSCVIFILLAGTWGRALVSSSYFWVPMIISFIPFLVFNGLLTRQPVVTYNPRSILGTRVTTIPLEDFFYNFTMLGFYFLVFLQVRPWLRF